MKKINKPKSRKVLVMYPLDLDGGFRMIRPETAVVNEFSEYQKLVGGAVQRVKWGDYTLYVDEDGLNKGLTPSLLGNGLVGTVVVTRFRQGKDIGLFASDIQLLMTPFDQA